MPLFKKRSSNEKDLLLSKGEDIVDCRDLLTRLLDDTYDTVSILVEYLMLIQDRDLKRIRLPEGLKNRLNNLKKLIEIIVSKCG